MSPNCSGLEKPAVCLTPCFTVHVGKLENSQMSKGSNVGITFFSEKHLKSIVKKNFAIARGKFKVGRGFAFSYTVTLEVSDI